MPTQPLSSSLHLRIGCKLIYDASIPTPALFALRPRLNDCVRLDERASFDTASAGDEYVDSHGNLISRVTLLPGPNEISYDALVRVSSLPDSRDLTGEMPFIDQLPEDVLRYILPSRYCDSDKLLDLAWRLFGDIPHGLPRVEAICAWVHGSIEYRFGSDEASSLAASQVIERGTGVCRDFAHTAIALCRALNLPARYVSGYLPDVGVIDSGTPMDFHAYMEVYLGQSWMTFDPRHNARRIGRVKISQGSDAVDGAFATIFGEALLSHFEVWAYQVAPGSITLDDPVDLTTRLDGTETVRLA